MNKLFLSGVTLVAADLTKTKTGRGHSTPAGHIYKDELSRTPITIAFCAERQAKNS
jgi:hypothetical protein